MSNRKLIARPPLISSSFTSLSPNRFDKIHLYEQTKSISTDQNKNEWRYELTILDYASIQKKKTSNILPCAVFLIPAGRESEYLFRTHKGLMNIAKSANCVRLIAVSFHRNHIYINQEYVQQELEKTVQIIAQRGIFWYNYINESTSNPDFSFKIPFLAVDGIGKRNVIAEGDTSTTGPFVVEEVKEQDADENENENENEKGEHYIRRLYFLNNPNVIQSEIYIQKQSTLEIVDKTRLAFDYHKHLSAGIIAFSYQLRKEMLVIGLGGGCLINFLHCLLPQLKITTVELDENIVQIAKSHFGFDDNSESVKVVIGDGLNVKTLLTSDDKFDEIPAMNNDDEILFPSSTFTSIAIDVDSKDNSVGISCPPVPFFSKQYLQQLKALLTPNGVLAINVSARDPLMLRLVKINVMDVFPYMFISSKTIEEDNADTDNDDEQHENDLNVVIFAKKESFSIQSIQKNIDFESIISKGQKQNLHDAMIVSDMQRCLNGIKQITMNDIEESKDINTDSQENQNSAKSSKTSYKKQGKKKKINNKKKKGKRK